MEIDDVIAEFEWTRPRHGGLVDVAAPILEMKPMSLSRALHRARKNGHDVRFTDTKDAWGK